MNSKKLFLNRANSLRSKSPLRRKRKKNGHGKYNSGNGGNHNGGGNGNNTGDGINGHDNAAGDGLKVSAVDGISMLSNTGSNRIDDDDDEDEEDEENNDDRVENVLGDVDSIKEDDEGQFSSKNTSSTHHHLHHYATATAAAASIMVATTAVSHSATSGLHQPSSTVYLLDDNISSSTYQSKPIDSITSIPLIRSNPNDNTNVSNKYKQRSNNMAGGDTGTEQGTKKLKKSKQTKKKSLVNRRTGHELPLMTINNNNTAYNKNNSGSSSGSESSDGIILPAITVKENFQPETLNSINNNCNSNNNNVCCCCSNNNNNISNISNNSAILDNNNQQPQPDIVQICIDSPSEEEQSFKLVNSTTATTTTTATNTNANTNNNKASKGFNGTIV